MLIDKYIDIFTIITIINNSKHNTETVKKNNSKIKETKHNKCLVFVFLERPK